MSRQLRYVTPPVMTPPPSPPPIQRASCKKLLAIDEGSARDGRWQLRLVIPPAATAPKSPSAMKGIATRVRFDEDERPIVDEQTTDENHQFMEVSHRHKRSQERSPSRASKRLRATMVEHTRDSLDNLVTISLQQVKDPWKRSQHRVPQDSFVSHPSRTSDTVSVTSMIEALPVDNDLTKSTRSRGWSAQLASHGRSKKRKCASFVWDILYVPS